MPVLKYAVWPDHISSKYDGDIHFISAGQLMRLYRVNPAECLVVNNKDNEKTARKLKLIMLAPRYHGDYEEYLAGIRD